MFRTATSGVFTRILVSRTRLVPVATLVLITATVTGCPEPPQPADTRGRDANTSDRIATDAPDVPIDQASPDVAMDATDIVEPIDAIDTGGSTDATVGIDATDTGADVTTGPETAVDAGPIQCSIPGAVVCTTDANCQTGETCIPSGCGTISRCQPAGRLCADDRDCQSGTQRCSNDVCVAASATDCGDTRACPLGYLCEGAVGSRRCVDRRHTCQIESDCPYGSSCYAVAGLVPFCIVVPTRCNDTFACLDSARCIDTDGDGLKECVPTGACLARDCPDAGTGTTCEMPRNEFGAACGLHGICSSSRPCAAGYSCTDMWNTGVPMCHPTANTCTSHAQCTAARSLCYDINTPETPGAPGCR